MWALCPPRKLIGGDKMLSEYKVKILLFEKLNKYMKILESSNLEIENNYDVEIYLLLEILELKYKLKLPGTKKLTLADVEKIMNYILKENYEEN